MKYQPDVNWKHDLQLCRENSQTGRGLFRVRSMLKASNSPRPSQPNHSENQNKCCTFPILANSFKRLFQTNVIQNFCI
jgi:hypothetical protein